MGEAMQDAPRSRVGPYQQQVREAVQQDLGDSALAFSRRWAPTMASFDDLRHLVPTHLHAAYFGEFVGPTDWEGSWNTVLETT